MKTDGERGLHVAPPTVFKNIVQSRGLTGREEIVVSDDYNCMFAARLWWVFRYYGLEVRVLNGAWAVWIETNGPISPEPSTLWNLPLTPELAAAGGATGGRWGYYQSRALLHARYCLKPFLRDRLSQ